MQNQILAVAEQKIEGQLTPQVRMNTAKIVSAGMKAGLQGGPNSILASLKNSKDPLNDCVMGAVNLVLLLRKQAKGVMPVNALVPASTILMMHALDFADKLGILKVDANVLATATQKFTNYILPKLRVTQPVLQSLTAHVHRVMANPIAMAKVRKAGGIDVAH